MSQDSSQTVNTELLTELKSNLEQYSSQIARVFHGRGRAFSDLSDLNIEWYPPYLFVQSYSESIQIDVKHSLLALFEEKTDIEAIIVQTRPWPTVENEILASRAAEELELPIEFTSKLDTNLNCHIHLGKNRNTGVFPDMRSGWYWINQHAQDKRVLNLFSYTGIFSLFAVNGGAKKVVNIDMCGSAIKTAQRNHQINNMNDERVSFWKRNILKSNNQIIKQSKFDLIVLDPPPFQKGSFNGWSDYEKLLRRCINYLREDGVILACLNNQKVSLSEFQTQLKEVLPDIKSLETLKLSHEIKESNPDEGLKLVLIKV